MPEERKSFEETLRSLGSQIEKGAKKLHPIKQSELDAVHAAVRRRFAESPEARGAAGWARKFEAWLGLIRSPFTYAGATAVIALLALGVLIHAGRDMTALEHDRGPGTIMLPPKARFVPVAARLELFEGKVRLSGEGTALPLLSRPGVSAYTNNLHGTDAAGLEVWVRSTVWVTNKSGVTTAKRPRDVAGVLVTGTLETAGHAPEPVSQGYAR